MKCRLMILQRAELFGERNKEGAITMKVRPSVKPMCEKCKVIKRKGHVMVISDNQNQIQRQRVKL